MAQRWLVVYSQAAYERAAATLNHARPREREAIHKQLFHLQAKRFATPEAAHEALTALANGWTYHQVDSYHLSDHQRYARKGRPTPRLPVKAIDWQIQARVRPAEAAIEHQTHRHACCVIGTNIGTSELPDTEVITAYTRQSQVEGGFRFLKDPLFFVSSLFVKKPCRIPGTLDGDDARLTDLCGGTAPIAPAIGPSPGNRAKPNQPTHHDANLTLGLPAIGRHSPRSDDRPSSGA